MSGREINRISRGVMIALSVTALLAVGSGYAQPLESDEGTAAHIFQLSMAALAPTILLFITTADWKQPWRSARTLAFTAALLAVAFAALYYLEQR